MSEHNESKWANVWSDIKQLEVHELLLVECDTLAEAKRFRAAYDQARHRNTWPRYVLYAVAHNGAHYIIRAE